MARGAMVERLNPETAAALAAYRTSTGMQLIDRDTGTRSVLRVLRAGEIVALVCDRMVGAGAPGLVVPMGDAAREVPTGPAALALATGAPVLTGHVVRATTGAARYALVIDPPLSPHGHTVESLTRAITTRLDRVIAQHPAEWYVFQPAWHDQHD
jgi:phosphatidylinositol dimannoside acyltransferase